MRNEVIVETFINGIKDPAIKAAVLLSGGAKQVAHGRWTQERQLDQENKKFAQRRPLDGEQLALTMLQL